MLINFFDDHDLYRSMAMYKNVGYSIHFIDFSCLFDFSKKYVLSLFSERLPLDPPLINCENLDAFSDSFFGGIDSLNENKVCICLLKLSNYKKNNESEFILLLEILQDNAIQLQAEGKDIVILTS